MNSLQIELNSILELDQEIYSLRWGIYGIDHALNPLEKNIMTGKIISIDIRVEKTNTIIKEYRASFYGSILSFYPQTIGSSIFLSIDELEKYYESVQKKTS